MKTTAAESSPSVVDQGLLTVAQAAGFLGIGRSKLYGLMDSGRLQYAKIGSARRIPRAAVVKLAESCLVGTGGEPA
jgi:excisionase family DNA binding protein